MVDRFKALVLGAPTDCRISMNFAFPKNYSMKEFLEKINIPQLFHNAKYWQGANFKFYAHGVDYANFFMLHEIDVSLDLLHYNLNSVAQKIHDEFQYIARHYFEPESADVQVTKMIISFFFKVYKL